MDKYEVTNAQYKAFVDVKPRGGGKDGVSSSQYHDGNYLKHWNGNNYPYGKGNHPVVYVNWYSCDGVCKVGGKAFTDGGGVGKGGTGWVGG